MWKFFIKNKDMEADIRELKEKFPGHCFYNGMHKDSRGCYATPQGSTTKKYAEKRESIQYDDVFYWSPEKPEAIDINDYKTDEEMRINVSLYNKQKISIVPAVAKPRKVLLGKRRIKVEERKEEYEFASTYNRDDKYAALAYDMLHVFAKDSVKFEDERLMDLIEMGLQESYTLPLDVINDIITLNERDISLLFFCCMGADEETLLKKSGE